MYDSFDDVVAAVEQRGVGGDGSVIDELARLPADRLRHLFDDGPQFGFVPSHPEPSVLAKLIVSSASRTIDYRRRRQQIADGHAEARRLLETAGVDPEQLPALLSRIETVVGHYTTGQLAQDFLRAEARRPGRLDG